MTIPVTIIPAKIVREMESDVVTSAALALRRLDKIKTAKTIKSLRSESGISADGITVDLYAGGGIKYIIEGKPANTKLPVRKVGDGFELIQDVKDWAAVVGFGGPHFLLARAIARNKQEPNDVAGLTFEIYQQTYGDKISSQLFSIYSQELSKEVKKVI